MWGVLSNVLICDQEQMRRMFINLHFHHLIAPSTYFSLTFHHDHVRPDVQWHYGQLGYVSDIPAFDKARLSALRGSNHVVSIRVAFFLCLFV